MDVVFIHTPDATEAEEMNEEGGSTYELKNKYLPMPLAH